MIRHSLLSIAIICFFFVDTAFSSEKISTVIIGGLGKQGEEYFDLLKETLDIRGIVTSGNSHTNSQKNIFLEKLKENNVIMIEGIHNLEKAITEKTIDFDIAIVSVPHYLHDEYTTLLLNKGKGVIKEKPLALNMNQVIEYEKIINSKSIPLFTTVQRHFQESLIKAKKDLSLLGTLNSYIYEYSFNLPQMTSGWRAHKELCSGGVILDMGYHIIDVVNTYFGMPDLETIQVERTYNYEETKIQGLEDKAIITMNHNSSLKGIIKISRHDQRKEEFIIKGSQGTMLITPQHYCIHDNKMNIIKNVEFQESKSQNKSCMFKHFIKNIDNKTYFLNDFERNKNNMRIIEHIYKIAL